MALRPQYCSAFPTPVEVAPSDAKSLVAVVRKGRQVVQKLVVLDAALRGKSARHEVRSITGGGGAEGEGEEAEEEAVVFDGRAEAEWVRVTTETVTVCVPETVTTGSVVTVVAEVAGPGLTSSLTSRIDTPAIRRSRSRRRPD